MKMFPVEFELYLDDEETVIGKFKAFDDESFAVEVKDQIMNSNDLRDIADKLDLAYKLLKEGV